MLKGKRKNMYAIGKMVRHKTEKMEGHIGYSLFGVSVNGYRVDEEGNLVRFHTVGMSWAELIDDWQRVYKFKYMSERGR